jgi:hypothetical protein
MNIYCFQLVVHYWFQICSSDTFKKSPVFLDVRPYSPEYVNRRFGEIYRLHLQGRKTSRARNQHKAGSLLAKSCWFLAWFILPA